MMETIGLAKTEFFEEMRKQGLALAFDDVRLETDHSEIMPADVDITSFFSRGIQLKIPLVSAAMDKVTEHRMAIAMAKLGGLGIIHKNLTPEQQAAEVARVKYHLHGLIHKPIEVRDTDTIDVILRRREEKWYRFHTFPVINSEGKLVGILTQNDFDFCRDQSLLAATVMTPFSNLVKVDETDNVDVQRAYEIMMESKKKVLPVLRNDGTLQGMYVFSDVKRIVSGESSRYNIDNQGRLRVGAAIGVCDDALARLEKLVPLQIDVVVIDTAHADSKSVIDTLREIKEQYSSLEVVVGNVSSPPSVRRLAYAGADGIKVGQGPGSICTTRDVAGIGTPQVTAVYWCSLEAKRHNIPVCADGGITHTGDITIAMGAGAYSVMLGNKLAGTNECPGEVLLMEGRQVKVYRGMGSIGAMKAYRSSRERYRQGDVPAGKLVPEGIEGFVEYKGPVEMVVHQCVGGLRSGMGYVGARNVEELIQKARFLRLTGAGQRESHPHDLLKIQPAPNYER
ncbi:MAG TPA: IMP dehydrogenase [Candidatus Nanoarchaeia archaeon]|nr:IMP dehydrogenase [Candidatus Nanoarchaeia archaeon]